MTSCTDCLEAEAYGSSRLYNPACLRCGQRYLAAIAEHPMELNQRRAWWKKALADWMFYGHAEQELRNPFSATDTPPESVRRTGPSGRRVRSAKGG